MTKQVCISLRKNELKDKRYYIVRKLINSYINKFGIRPVNNCSRQTIGEWVDYLATKEPQVLIKMWQNC